MPQKIHLANKNSRPAVGRFSTLAQLGLRPIQAEPVQYPLVPRKTYGKADESDGFF